MTGAIKRAAEIASILSAEGLDFVASLLGVSALRQTGNEATGIDSLSIQEVAVRLRRAFERLGPLYVKVGQVLAARRDILPEAFCSEMAQLHASATPFAGGQAVEIVEEELGAKIEDLFDTFDPLPLASASLAQAHRARLKSGQDVVVKIRRPDAAKQIQGDAELLLWLSRRLAAAIPAYRRLDLHHMVEDIIHHVRLELDFLNEASVAEKFADHFASSEHIVIPRIHRSHTASAVLVLDFIDGKRLDTFKTLDDFVAAGLDPKQIVKNLMECVMRQACQFGLLHADLHPGNVFALPSNRLALIDFGLHGALTRRHQAQLTKLILARAEGRHDDVADSLLEIMEPMSTPNPEAYRRDIVELSERYYKAKASEMTMAESMMAESAVGIRHGYRSPAAMTMFGRALIVVEGLAIRFTPDLNLSSTLRPVMTRILMQRLDVQQLARETSTLIPDLIETIEMMPKICRILLRAERQLADAGSVGAFLSKEILSSPKRASHESRLSSLALPALWIATLAVIVTNEQAMALVVQAPLLPSALLCCAIVASVSARR